jgi:mannose-6-phosphate isomerase-like protein (cupin superfamily)
MRIDGEVAPITAGDCVHVPLGVGHGVRNTGADEHLRLFLTFIRRDG